MAADAGALGTRGRPFLQGWARPWRAIRAGGASASARLLRWLNPDRSQPVLGAAAGALAGREALLLAAVVLVAAIAHSVNLFGAPFYETEERLIVGEAVAVLQGGLAPDRYWYNHPPLGWFTLAGWMFAFQWLSGLGATLIDVARTFMLPVHLASVALVFLLARRTTGHFGAATVAALLFSLPPILNIYQRRVLLENLAMLLVLASMAFALARSSRSLTPVAISGAIFGTSLLMMTGMALAFLPAVVAALLIALDRRHLLLGLTVWGCCAGVVFGTWLAYAYLRNELLPAGMLPWDSAPHTSLLGTLGALVLRDQNGPGLLSLRGDAWDRLSRIWVQEEPIGLGLMAVGVLAAWVWASRRPALAPVAFAALGALLLPVAGVAQIEHAVLPLAPWAAICAAATLVAAYRWADTVARRQAAPQIASVSRFAAPALAVLLASLWFLRSADSVLARSVFLDSSTTAQDEATRWLDESVPRAALAPNGYPAIDQWRLGVRNAFYYWRGLGGPTLARAALTSQSAPTEYLVVQQPTTGDPVLLALLYERWTGAPVNRTTNPDGLALAGLKLVRAAAASELRIPVRITAEKTTSFNVLLEIRDAAGTVIGKDTAPGATATPGRPFETTLVTPWPAGLGRDTRIVVAAYDDAWSTAYFWRQLDSVFPG